jgi:predicted nucleic acid-binding protein
VVFTASFGLDRTRLIEQDTERLLSYQQVTDAHLLTLAAGHDGALVTFDRGIAEMAGHDRRGRV